MPIVVECSSCDGRFRAKDSLKGKELPCPKCKESLTVDGPWVSPFDVFLSHSSKDTDIANAVCHALEEKGVRCWIAPRDIPAGQKWAESIVQGISDCSIMILLVSDDSVLSQQVMNELEHAVSQNLKILPVRIEEVELTSEMSYFLSRTHWMDAFPKPIDEYLEKLTKDVRKLLSDDDGPAKAPPRKNLAGDSSRGSGLFRTFKRLVFLSALCVGVYFSWPWLIQVPALIQQFSESSKGNEPGFEDESPDEGNTSGETEEVAEGSEITPDEASSIAKVPESSTEPITKPISPPKDAPAEPKKDEWSLIRKFQDHNHYVTAIDFHPEGTSLLSSSYDGTMKVFDLETGTVIQSFELTSADVPRGSYTSFYDAAFVKDGSMIASAHGRQFRLWTVGEEKVTRLLEVPGVGEPHLASAGDGTRIMMTLADSLLVTSVEDAKTQYEIDNGGYALTDVVAIPSTGQVAALSNEPLLKLWNLETNQIVRNITLPNRGGFECLAVSHDGTRIAAGGTRQVMIWSLKDGLPIHTLTPYESYSTSMQVSSIAFSPNDQFLIAGNETGETHVWDLDHEELLKVFDSQNFTGPGRQVRAAAFSPDGKNLAIGRTNGQVELYQTASPLHGVSSQPQTLPQMFRAASSKETSKSEGTKNDWSLIRSIHEQSNDINSLVFSPDDISLLSASRDGTLKLYEVSTGFVQSTLSTSEDDPLKGMPFWDAATPPDGSIIASLHDHRVRIWYPGEELTTKEVYYADAYDGLTFNFDGSLIAVGGRDEVLLIDSAKIDSQKTLMNAWGLIWDLAFVPGDKYLVTNSLGKVVQIWDLNSGQILKTLNLEDQSGAAQVAVSADGLRVAAATPDSIFLWNMKNGELECKLQSKEKLKPLCYEFSPRSEHLFVGYDSGEVLVWDLSTREVIHTIDSTVDGNDRDVLVVALNHQGTVLAVGRDDGHVDFFRTPASYHQKETLQEKGDYDFVDFSQVQAGRKPEGWAGSSKIAVNFNDGAPGFQPVSENLTELESVSYKDLNLSGNFFVEVQLRATNQESMTLDLMTVDGTDSIELELKNEQYDGWCIAPKSGTRVKGFKDWHESVDQGIWLRLEHVIENGKAVVYASVDGRLQEQKPLTTGTLAKFYTLRLGFPRGPNTRKIQNLRWGPLRDEPLLKTLDFAPPLPAGGRKLPLGWEIHAGIVGEQKPQRLAARELSMGENFQVEWEVKVENDDGRFSLNLLGHHGGPTLPVHFHFTKDPGRELLKVNLSGVKKPGNVLAGIIDSNSDVQKVS